jgi:raffinose/stachyose/melibiose transport system permease protein
MATLTSDTAAGTRQARQRTPRGGASERPNWVGGVFAWIWLAIVIIPIYWIVITSFKSQDTYFASNAMAPPTSPTMEN